VFCREHVAQVRAHEVELAAAGARLAAVGLGDRQAARAFRAEAGIGFPVLVDEDRQAYRAAGLGKASLLHLVRRDNFLARARARAAGHRQGRTGAHPFQLGGSLVLGPGDVDRLVHRSRTFGDNAPVADLLAALGRRPPARP
jgi:hypothetical protein